MAPSRSTPSDDAGDEGGISDWVSLNKQATDPNSHTLVKSLLQETQRYRYLQIPMVDPRFLAVPTEKWCS